MSAWIVEPLTWALSCPFNAFLSSAVLQMAEVRTLEFWMKTHNVSAETGGPYRVRLQRKEGGGQSISFYLKRIKKTQRNSPILCDC